MPETRPSLVARLRDRANQPAWAEFVEAYEPFLQRLVRRLGVSDRHAPDVVQQTLLAIARSVDDWQDDGQPGSFRRWLQRVARNIVIKFMTRERRQIGGLGGSDFLDQLQQTPDRVDDAFNQRYEHELFLWAAEQVRSEFRPASWSVFWMTQIDGRPIAEVAVEQGVSVGSIYMTRCRIMARIRARVTEVLE